MSKGGGKERRDGDWDCPQCGALVFANKTHCFKCGAPKDAPAKTSLGIKASPSDAVKAFSRVSPNFKKAWVAYCKGYGNGYSDPTKYDEAYIIGFADYAADLLTADLNTDPFEEEGQQPSAAPPPITATTPAPAAAPNGLKRKGVAAPDTAPAPPEKKKLVAKAPAAAPAAASAPPEKKKVVAKAAAATPAAASSSAPPEKKKLTIRKGVADEIRRLNTEAGLLAEIRIPAVAAALGELGEQIAMEALAALEAQAAEIADPNVFLKTYSQGYEGDA